MESEHNFIEKSKIEKWKELVHTVDVFNHEDPIPMDEGIKETVVSLMAHNFNTAASCFGHVNTEDGTPFPWVAIRGDKTVDALLEDEHMEKLNERYFSEDAEDVKLLSQEEIAKVQQVQKIIKESKENERQRLLKYLNEFYSGHEAEPGIKLTVIADFCWLCPEDEVFGIYSS